MIFHGNFGKHLLRRRCKSTGFPRVLKCNMRYAFFIFNLFMTPLSKQINSIGDSVLKLQEMCSFSQNVCIEVYGILNTSLTPLLKVPYESHDRAAPAAPESQFPLITSMCISLFFALGFAYYILAVAS